MAMPMRSVSFVNRIEFDFSGNVARNALALGDIDNDGCFEFAIGNENGDLTIFKGEKKFQSFSKLGFITCIAIGDILNESKNCLVVVTGDGWCYIYDMVESDEQAVEASEELVAEQMGACSLDSKEESKEKLRHLVCIHTQRIPPNAKDLLLGDVDGDGKIELVIGLTDRVVRTYRWTTGKSPKPTRSCSPDPEDGVPKLIALNKWECAQQIGSISLHHEWNGRPCLLVAQPGGTFMRIRCHLDGSPSIDRNKDKDKDNAKEKDKSDESGEPLAEELGKTDDVENVEDDDTSEAAAAGGDEEEVQDAAQESTDNEESPEGENIQHSTVDYQALGLSRMRDPNISTEILGDLRTKEFDMLENAKHLEDTGETCDGTKARPYAIATLDGTIMLVQDEVILWAFAVDHQVFALEKVDCNDTGSDDIVACCWNGQTYLIDHKKNIVRYNLNEPVRGFISGYYSVTPASTPVACLVYLTFKNKIFLYHDLGIKHMEVVVFNPDLSILSPLFVDENTTEEQAAEELRNMDRATKRELIHYLFYGFGRKE